MATTTEPPLERPYGTAECCYCTWCAEHRADTPLEVATFLRQLLVAHIEEQHQDRTETYMITEERQD